MELIVLLVVLGVVGAVAVAAMRRHTARELQRREDELAPVKKLAFEDITAFGVDLQELDYELSGHDLDAGANADYQRALDTYESAKTAGDSITEPEDIRHVTSIVEDGRYAIACVRARVEDAPSPPGARPASSTRGTARRSPTSSSSRRTASSATCPRAPSTSSASTPAPSPTSAR